MLLGTSDFSRKLHESINASEASLFIASAFIKLEALSKLSDLNPGIDVVVVSRWQKHDLLAGASDLEVYSFCKSKGWKFGISLNFHGKLYLIDRKEIYLGSANFTLKGLNLTDICNIEFGTVIPVQRADLDKIELFLDQEITWIDDHKFQMIEQEIASSKNRKEPLHNSKWSHELEYALTTDVNFLWVHELLFHSPFELLNIDLNDELQLHDFELLGLDLDNIDPASLRKQFKRTRLFLWASNQLREQGEMNFGAFSQYLHNALLDDPTPYRREVKEFIATLFEWFKLLDNELILTQHRKTVSVKFREEA